MNLQQLIIDLIDFKYESEQNFDNAIDILNEILEKINNMKNIRENKIIFVGRAGSMKNELILNLIKLNLSKHSISKLKNKYIEYISENDNYGIMVDDKFIAFESFESLDNYFQSNSIISSHIKIFYPRSENGILKDKIVMDTPFYDYSDESDDEIVNNCRDGHIFIVVLNAVGAIGYRDKKFLNRITKINFIKLIYIFNFNNPVTELDYRRTKDQHETNAIRISNEILIPPQENIPIFFVENILINEDQVKSVLKDSDFNKESMKDYTDKIRQEIKQVDSDMKKQKSQIAETIIQTVKDQNYEEEQKERTRNNKKKNEYMDNLKKFIETNVNVEDKITTSSKPFHDIFEIIKNFCEIRQERNAIKTDSTEKRMEEDIELSDDEQLFYKKSFSEIINDLKNLCKNMLSFERNEKTFNDLTNDALKKNRNKERIDPQHVQKYIEHHNNNLIKQEKHNNDRNNNQIKTNIQSTSSNKCDDKIPDKNCEFIVNQLNNMKNIFQEFDKYSQEYSQFLTNLFEYISDLIKYMKTVLEIDLTRNHLNKILPFPIFHNNVIGEINFDEIESFNDLLIILLVIEILFAKTIAEENNKYSPSWISKYSPSWISKYSPSWISKYSPSCISKYSTRSYLSYLWKSLITNHHKININMLNNSLKNLKFFQKFIQTNFTKCEIIDISNIKSDSLENMILQNNEKLELLNKAEQQINNFIDELDKII